MPEFAQSELAWRGIRCAFAQADPARKNEFPGLTALPEADLLFISVRRRTPSNEQMDGIRRHLAAGKAVVGIRTASHAFGATPPDGGHQGWATFDTEVLGGRYQGHYNNHPPKDPPTLLWIRPEAAGHPVLTGVPTNEIRVTSWLYRSRRLAATVTPLMSGRVEGRSEIEPVAWVNTNQTAGSSTRRSAAPTIFSCPPSGVSCSTGHSGRSASPSRLTRGNNRRGMPSAPPVSLDSARRNDSSHPSLTTWRRGTLCRWLRTQTLKMG